MPFPSPAAAASSSPSVAAAMGAGAADALESFTLRMMAHGLCVSSTLMQHDRRYALDQLAYARGLDDDPLRALAQQLFWHFGQGPSGAPHYN